MSVPYENKEAFDAEQRAEMEALYAIADAELNSEKKTHEAFARSRGQKSFARYHVLPEVIRIARRDGFNRCHQHQCLFVAQKIAADWYSQREKA